MLEHLLEGSISAAVLLRPPQIPLSVEKVVVEEDLFLSYQKLLEAAKIVLVYEGEPDACAMFFVIFVGEHALEDLLFCHLADALLLDLQNVCLW